MDSTPKRILVIRLDRIGDVVLTTPLLRALRQACPSAWIAMLVRPPCHELLDGHPDLNEVLVYDKAGRHRGVLSTIRFAWRLRRQRFDTAIVVHPTHRSHWIARLAGIPRRIGYARKSGWLLTRRVPHRKQEGSRHEAEYALELLEVLGIAPTGPPRPFVPVQPEAQRFLEDVLRREGIGPDELLVAIHPSASCVSKRWMPQRFGEVADRLIEAQRVRVVLVAGSEDAGHAQEVARAMRHPPLNLAGKLSVGELAALLARCRLLISNDSGPVHVAAAVGTPVVALFGRAQPGINAARWRPLGAQHIVLDKSDASRFTAIDQLSVEEVYQAAASVLERSIK